MYSLFRKQFIIATLPVVGPLDCSILERHSTAVTDAAGDQMRLIGLLDAKAYVPQQVGHSQNEINYSFYSYVDSVLSFYIFCGGGWTIFHFSIVSSPFYFFLIKFHCNFSISYKIIPYYIY